MSTSKSSDAVLVKYDIPNGADGTQLNELYDLLLFREGPAALELRDSDGETTTVHVEKVTSLQTDEKTRATHFTGDLVGGGTITGQFTSHPADDNVDGRATISIKPLN